MYLTRLNPSFGNLLNIPGDKVVLIGVEPIMAELAMVIPRKFPYFVRTTRPLVDGVPPAPIDAASTELT